MSGARERASSSSCARYASRVSRLTRQTPFLPIFNAGRSPDRISVYTCVTVTLSTAATSAGFKSGGGSGSLVMVASEVGCDGLRRDSCNRLPVAAAAVVPSEAVAT